MTQDNMPNLEFIGERLREERDRLLTESDFRVLAGVPWDVDAWIVYRQALRDVPQQEGFPTGCVFPERPQG